jgi:hypothetical protein
MLANIYCINRVTRRPGFGCFVLMSWKTFSGSKNVQVFKNRSIAHNKSSLIGLICAKIIHVYKLSLKSQWLLDYYAQNGVKMFTPKSTGSHFNLNTAPSLRLLVLSSPHQLPIFFFIPLNSPSVAPKRLSLKLQPPLLSFAATPRGSVMVLPLPLQRGPTLP